MKLPKARTENLLEQNLKDETLIYDLTVNEAFNLNETLTIVYKACGQNQTFDELKQKHTFTDEFIYLALDELKRNDLLAKGAGYVSPFGNTSRREVIKKVGLASMTVLPIITGLVAPKAVNAASGGSDAAAAARGGYNQACLPNPYIPNSPYCSTDLYCVPTASGEERCCQYSRVGGSVRQYPGGSVTQTNGPIYIRREDAVTSDNTSCQYNLACCDGSSAVGTCTYQSDTTNEYGDADYAGFEQSGFYPYLQTCTCTCP